MEFANGLKIVPQFTSILTLKNISTLTSLINPLQEVDIPTLVRCLFCSDPDSKELNNLKNIVDSFDNHEAKSFLKFITGQSVLMSKEQSDALWNPNADAAMRDKILVTFDSTLDEQLLPTAHVCFYQLVLPVYSSKELMKEKLLKALEVCTDHLVFCNKINFLYLWYSFNALCYVYICFVLISESHFHIKRWWIV
jgi:hypothetical protein